MPTRKFLLHFLDIYSIALIISYLVVMNTLVMSVSERTKEIGILMAIGWSRFMIVRKIVLEAIIICFIGGILGNLMGLLQLWFFSYMNPEGLGWWVSMSSSTDIFLKSIVMSILLGIVSSLYPALLSTKLLPAEALRRE